MGLRSESVITKAQEGSNRVRSGRDKDDGWKQERTGCLELSEVILWAASSSVEDNALCLEKETTRTLLGQLITVTTRPRGKN